MYKYLLLISASAVPGAAYAQTASEQALEEIIAAQDEANEAGDQQATVGSYRSSAPAEAIITVTANGLGTDLRNTGQSVTVIGREEIETIQGADPARALARVPGLSLSRSGGVGTVTSVNVRGANPDQLLVLVDGVRVADQASPSGGFDFGNLLLGTAGKIDVLRGSNSTIWGSEAVGGVIDISTRAERGMTASVEYGSRDTLFASAAAGAGNDNAFIGLTGSWFETDGFSAAASGTEADGSKQFAIGSSAFLNLTPSLELFAHGNFAEGDVEIDGFPAPAFALADTYEVQETRQTSGIVGAIYDGGPLYLRGAYSFSDTERDNLPRSGATPSFSSDGESERVELRGEWRPIGPLILNFGAENLWSTYENGARDEETGIFGAYVQAGIEFGGLAGHVGVRQDEHEDFGGATSFGGDLTFEIVPNLRLRASVGEGFKAPSLYQLYSDYGNSILQPEESTSYDLGIAYGTRTSPFYASVTAFQRDSENLIAFVGCPVQTGICDNRPFGTYDNVSQARARGVEVEAGATPVNGLTLRAAYAYTEAEDRSTGTANFGNELARRPSNAAPLSFDWAPLPDRVGVPVIGGDLRIVGEAFDNAANTVVLDGYTVFDLRVSMPLGKIAGERPVEIFARAENLFDEEYQTAAGYAQAPRGIFAGLRVGL